MPLVFSIFGFAIFYAALLPVIDMASDAIGMFVAADAPKFSQNLTSIYQVPDSSQQKQMIKTSQIQWPKFGMQYGEISCDRIELKANLYMGDSNEILKVGAGNSLSSMIPGYGKPILIGGHCTSFFAPLQNIKTGDIITVKTSYGIYEYRVTGTKIALPTDKSAYDLRQNKEQLILYTCYPFKRLSGPRTHRLFVYADKIEGPVLVDG